ncbi:MAG: hypothetical protein AMS17_12855 [Spirochaetes bacterium DG_61]|nr:MAG: hypothetical protein AMS17_12855 [Spirochaetes bacterium DG_61]
MIYMVCILAGIVTGLIGGLLIVRGRLPVKSGGGGTLSPEQFEKIKAILKHIEDGDKILEKIQELLEEK